MRKILIPMSLILLLTACRDEAKPTATPYPTYTPFPTYTPYLTDTPRPTDTPVSLPVLHGWQEAQVVRVNDGDTIEVTIHGQAYRVRYIGINAPEEGELCYDEATRFNAYLVTRLDKTVYLEKDISEVDQHGRLLRYVWVAGPDEYIMVNAELVAMGYAKAIAYPPDVKHKALLTQMEQQARQVGLVGCWPTPTPTVTPTATPHKPTATTQTATSTLTPPIGCPQGCLTPPPGCVIKGNISSSTGEKIYHMPGQRYYDQTTIDPSKGERWFCTEEEAIANGWRKSKR
ncbi:MAG: sunset domain-containing protein [Anaerolineae bacterium]